MIHSLPRFTGNRRGNRNCGAVAGIDGADAASLATTGPADKVIDNSGVTAAVSTFGAWRMIFVDLCLMSLLYPDHELLLPNY